MDPSGITHFKEGRWLMNEKRMKNYNQKNEDEPTASTHSAPRSAVWHFCSGFCKTQNTKYRVQLQWLNYTIIMKVHAFCKHCSSIVFISRTKKIGEILKVGWRLKKIPMSFWEKKRILKTFGGSQFVKNVWIKKYL